MKRVGMLALLLLGGAPLTAQQVPSVALLPFSDGGSYGQDKESFAALGVAIPALLARELQAGGANLVDAGSGDSSAASSRPDAAEAARIGRRVGASYVVTGAFMDHYGRFRLDARIVDVATASITRVVSNDPSLQDRRQLAEMIRSVAIGLLKEWGRPAPPTAQAVSTDAITLYGRALLSGNDAQAARGFLQRALQIDGDFAAARDALARLGGS
jgi:TolB-like protein